MILLVYTTSHYLYVSLIERLLGNGAKQIVLLWHHHLAKQVTKIRSREGCDVVCLESVLKYNEMTQVF